MPAPSFPDTPRGQAPATFHLRNFAGINRDVPRSSIADQQFYWLENFMPVANGALRAMFAEAATLATAGATIVNAYFFSNSNFPPIPFVILFLTDGSAIQVNTSTGATTTVAVAGTFGVSGAGNPVAAQWNSGGIVITSPTPTNAYWAWDGATLTSPGGAAPSWLTGGVVTTMPNGVHGSAIEIYQNRVWIGNNVAGLGSSLITSAPANGADFLTADGSVTTPINDASLKNSIIALRQANGILYMFGDSNVSTIYNVVTGGSPVVTTFTLQNLDPQTGAAWQNSVQLLGQILVFATKDGVYALNGGIPVKISYELDRMFAAADFTVTPSAAVATIFGIKCYLLLIKTADQVGTQRNILCVWDTKEWFIASQVNANLSLVFPQEFLGQMTAWGIDTTHVFQLFQVPSTSLSKIMQTKLWASGQTDELYNVYKKTYRVHEELTNYDTNSFTITSTLDAVGLSSAEGSAASTTVAFSFSISAGTAQPATTSVIVGTDVSCYGLLIGVTQTMTGKDFALASLQVTWAADQTFVG